MEMHEKQEANPARTARPYDQPNTFSSGRGIQVRSSPIIVPNTTREIPMHSAEMRSKKFLQSANFEEHEKLHQTGEISAILPVSSQEATTQSNLVPSQLTGRKSDETSHFLSQNVVCEATSHWNNHQTNEC